MLANAPVTTTIRVADLEGAKSFYKDKLGLKEIKTFMEGEDVLYEAGGGTKIYVYKGPASVAEHTVASFEVPDVLAEVNELKAKGVQFETYTEGPLKTDENNIAHLGEWQAAWFKDPEGHILAVGNM